MIRERISAAIHTAFTLFICFSLLAFSAIQIRYGAAVIGLIPLPQANAYENEMDPSQSTVSGKVTISAEYCSEVVAADDPENRYGRTSTMLTFDDAWFSGDSRIYNHDLATACSVLSAVCNSESQFYGNVDGSVPYAEQALGALGFSDIRSESYALRSNLFDQIATFFIGPYDVSAYVFASKTIPGKGDAPDETLIFIGIRGSYGTEWLSNLRLFGDGAHDSDHPGFRSTKEEIIESLEAYAQEIGAVPAHTKMLVTGHSRGGALANLLAADLDAKGNRYDSLASSRNIFAYTFATPGTTKADHAGDAVYRNIFNIVNPSDIVPQFPLSAWGYAKYGTTVILPSSAEDDFHATYRAMQEDYQENTGCSNPCSAKDLGKLDGLDAGAAAVAPTMESVWSFQTLYSLIQALCGIDVSKALIAHYPDTYIAWMQSIDSHQVLIR